MDPMGVCKFPSDEHLGSSASHHSSTKDINILDGQEQPEVETRRNPLAVRCGRKPPYTYLGMIVVAIHTSPNRRLTRAGVHNAIAEMFDFFKGEYTGWKRSVSNNLSSHQCFIRDTATARGAGGNWSVDLSTVPTNALHRRGKKDEDLQWAPTLTIQLGIQDIILPAQQLQNKPGKFQPIVPSSNKAFSIDSILRPADTKPVTIGEPPDTKYNHPYSFLGYQNSLSYQMYDHRYSPYAAKLYQTVRVQKLTQPDAISSLCPAPSYGETTPFSSLIPHQNLPSHIPSATDLSTRRQSDPSEVQENTGFSQDTQDITLRSQKTMYTSHSELYPTPSHNQSQSASPAPHTFSSTSSTSPAHVAASSQSSSQAWLNLLNYASSCHTRSPQPTGDDKGVAMFSDASSIRSCPSIPMPVFSDDSLSQQDMSEFIRDTHVMLYDFKNSLPSPEHKINIYS